MRTCCGVLYHLHFSTSAMDYSHHVVSPSQNISSIVLSALQPLFETLLAHPGQHDTVTATKVILDKLKPLSCSESMFIEIPRCCLSTESFRRIRSPSWLKDDLLTVFTNITNFAFNVNNSGKYRCLNTQQTSVFLQEPFDAIKNDSDLLESFRTGNFAQKENCLADILKDWFSSTRVGILTSFLSRPIEDYPTCIIFLDFINDSHYIIHQVTIINHKNTIVLSEWENVYKMYFVQTKARSTWRTCKKGETTRCNQSK